MKSVKKRSTVERKIKENKTLYTWTAVIMILIGIFVLWYILKTGVQPGEAVKMPPMQDCCCSCLGSRQATVLGFMTDCTEACTPFCTDELMSAKTCTKSEKMLFLQYR